MSNSAYNQYNTPYQRSSAQQHTSYQTASASNNFPQSSRQYLQPPITQSQDYRPYPTQSYTHQDTGYATVQGTTWNHGSYGGARETTNQAAKVLHNMSNLSYTTNIPAATNRPAFTSHSATPSNTSRYATANSLAGKDYPVYGQSEAQPHNVNIDHAKIEGYALPSPATAPDNHSHAAKPTYKQQPQRTVSPAQPLQNPTTVASNTHSATSTTGNQRYGGHNSERLTSTETSRNSQNITRPSTYIHGTEPMPPAAVAPPATDDTYYTQGTTTVDPMAVYDPWPEYQRKQAAQRAAEDAVRAEKEKIQAEERKQQEEMDNLRQPRPSVTDAASTLANNSGSSDPLESEIRAMMAKIRELNNKDPALLARIWEEERKAKASRPPTTQAKPTPQATPTVPTQPARASSTQPAISRESTAPREVTNANVSNLGSPATAHAPVGQAQMPTSRPAGSTIWPPKKRAELAKAAATYLNSQDSLYKVTPTRILSLLNGNPSYIELCEQLEKMNLKLDRTAFAKSLLTAVPDVNSNPRPNQYSPPTAPVPVQRPPVPPAVMKKEVSNSVAPTSASGPSVSGAFYSPSSENSSPSGPPVPATASVAEMIPIKPEFRKPANKAEAARKRNLSELVDLTQLSDEDAGPPFKKLHTGPKNPLDSQGVIHGNEQLSTPNFPMANGPLQPPQSFTVRPQMPNELRNTTYVYPIERNKALRRNNYNPATIARDVLLACGRHPSQRSLNAHLDVLRTTLSQITFDSDLSTIRWDLIDPGNPPPDYFRDKVEDLAQDDDHEDDSDDEERPPRSPSNLIGGQTVQVKAQALPEAINPFVKPKRRGPPPRSSLPNAEQPKSPTTMSDKPTSGAAGVGYSAFRSATQHGPDGSLMPKKRGRPVGWRKAIHGSAAVNAPQELRQNIEVAKNQQPPQPSPLSESAVRIDSRSPSVANRVFQSYKCKWLNCKADLHNLDTLKKHVFKVHRKEVYGNMLDCLWDDCGKEAQPPSFDLESNWRSHVQQTHFDPLSWELGDGPASGLSDSHESDAYLSDAQGRQVTPRITVEPERVRTLSMMPPEVLLRSRGRPPKRTLEQEARDAHDRLMSLKSRIGGLGMDRGGATLVNNKRRRGLIDETEEEIVNVEN